LATAIALLQVVQSSSAANTGQKLQQLEARRSELKARVHELEAEVAALASLERTERAARERLGMVPARDQQYIAVDVPSPSVPLLPRPLLEPTPVPDEESEPWWRALLKAVP